MAKQFIEVSIRKKIFLLLFLENIICIKAYKLFFCK